MSRSIARKVAQHYRLPIQEPGDGFHLTRRGTETLARKSPTSSGDRGFRAWQLLQGTEGLAPWQELSVNLRAFG